MNIRDVICQARADRGLPLVFTDERRDQFDRDGALLAVDHTACGAIHKAWDEQTHGRAGHQRNQEATQVALLHRQRLHCPTRADEQVNL